ncbi:MAG TPA: hypothetical protein VF461_09320 [Gemmatimonadaceae bacterium]
MTPSPDVVYAGALPGGAMTRQDVAILRAQRAELSSQLSDVTRQRRSLADQVNHSNGVSKAGLEARLAVLDQRILHLESEIDRTGQQLASPQAAQYGAETRPPQNFGPPFKANFDATPVAICAVLFVASPIALSISRLLWKRGSRKITVPPPTPESTERLERIEQAVDAIAIEVERVSEGQRFVTRLLSERAPAIGAAPAEPVRVPVGEASRVR